jgi:alkylhydroperoxidase family enzyme
MQRIASAEPHAATGRTKLAAARVGRSADPKAQAALQFAREVALRRGQVPDEDFDRVRAAGWTDAEIAELLAHVALSTFTNYFAVATGAEIDSPVVRVGESLAA